MSSYLGLNPALSTSLAGALSDIATSDKLDSRASPPPSRPPPKPHGRRKHKAYNSTENLASGRGKEEGVKLESAWEVGEGKEEEGKEKEKEKIRKHTTIGQGVEDAVTVIIPDLEDVADADLLVTVASAPAVKVNRFKTMQELDGELVASSGQLIEPPTSLAGIDVSLLVAMALNPPDQLVEPDVHWDWDVVFTEVTSDLHLEPPGASV
ncbi:hypothetical protein PhCBS80983_g05891 [Powellomyces hirtus]|uniref:Intraflagellar transport protein 43 n=1 Tax=Powellomyces hirtus TaxID=109895 RepID=A0A507DS21_9FUNG|nr:hypothetical protein PhCBS80983_g05891 [Powellomyces hirtus]